MEQPTSDRQLLERYVSDGSQIAFARLVERHIRLVYATCYRELQQKELAEEATQLVFLTLAAKAKTIRPNAGFSSWLYTTARYKASSLRIQERRRMAREQTAAGEAMRTYERSDEEAWRSIEPALNDALSALSAPDRQAILLRFFGEMSMRQVSVELGTSEDAARMRVSRALEKLRDALVNRKAATISAAALCALLTERATFAVPAQLSSEVAQSSTPTLAPPVSSAVAQVGGGGPLLTKGLLIVSTYKIVTWASVVLLLLIALLFVGVHQLRSGMGIQPVRYVVAKYSVSEFSPLPGYAGLQVNWMNNKGDVVGAAMTRDGHARPFYGHAGVLSEIPAPGGYDVAYADYISDKGTIWGDVGSKVQPVDGIGIRQLVAVTGTKDRLSPYAPLPDPMSRRGSRFSEVDDQGAVVYAEHTGMNRYTLFSAVGVRQSPITTFPDCAGLVLSAMNSKGDIVGIFRPAQTALPQPCVYAGGKLTMLPTPAGTSMSWPGAMSDSGYIVGVAGSPGPNGVWLAWLYRGGSLESLGTLPGYQGSGVNAVNNAGVAVGDAFKPKGPSCAVVYENGKVIDLNRRIDSSPGLVLQSADCINDRGQILCDGQEGGKDVLVLLTPES